MGKAGNIHLPGRYPPGGTGGYTPGLFREKAMEFLKDRLDEKTYNIIMNSGDLQRHPYVAARIYLGSDDWEKYVYIEKHGSLDGFES